MTSQTPVAKQRTGLLTMGTHLVLAMAAVMMCPVAAFHKASTPHFWKSTCNTLSQHLCSIPGSHRLRRPTISPRQNLLGYGRSSRISMSAASTPVGEMMPSIELLAKACRAAKDAVEKSTGEGTESSGSGRYEWGTWCDEKLFSDVRDAVEAIGLKGSPELWPALWNVVGGEKHAAKMLVARGKDWYCYLHIFMNSKEYTGHETFKAQHPTGMYDHVVHAHMHVYM
jgi:hypothetical protein